MLTFTSSKITTQNPCIFLYLMLAYTYQLFFNSYRDTRFTLSK